MMNATSSRNIYLDDKVHLNVFDKINFNCDKIKSKLYKFICVLFRERQANTFYLCTQYTCIWQQASKMLTMQYAYTIYPSIDWF